MGLRPSSGLSHLPEFGADEHESLRSKRRRPMKASTRLGGKTNRRRRLDEEDEHTEEVGRLNRKRKRGEQAPGHNAASCMLASYAQLGHVMTKYPSSFLSSVNCVQDTQMRSHQLLSACVECSVVLLHLNSHSLS